MTVTVVHLSVVRGLIPEAFLPRTPETTSSDRLPSHLQATPRLSGSGCIYFGGQLWRGHLCCPALPITSAMGAALHYPLPLRHRTISGLGFDVGGPTIHENRVAGSVRAYDIPYAIFARGGWTIKGCLMLPLTRPTSVSTNSSPRTGPFPPT